MVQITTAEQGELKRSVARSVPLIESGAGILGSVQEDGTIDSKIVIDAILAGEFACKTLMLSDDPDLGWKLESGLVEEDRANALIGVIPDGVRLVSPSSNIVEITVNDFAQEDAQNPRQMAEYIGPLAALRWHRAG